MWFPCTVKVCASRAETTVIHASYPIGGITPSCCTPMSESLHSHRNVFYRFQEVDVRLVSHPRPLHRLS